MKQPGISILKTEKGAHNTTVTIGDGEKKQTGHAYSDNSINLNGNSMVTL